MCTSSCAFTCFYGPLFYRKQSKYITCVVEASTLTAQRLLSGYQQLDLIFHLTPSGFRYRKVIGYIHQRTEEIIQERRMSLLKEEEQKRLKEQRRLDLLDVLLTARVCYFGYSCKYKEVHIHIMYVSLFAPTQLSICVHMSVSVM